MTTSDFSKYYLTISNTELVSILSNPNNYESLAIEAAKKEFSRRELSEAEIISAKKTLNEIQSEKEKRIRKVKSIENKFKSAKGVVIDNLNPIQTGTPSGEKTIRVIVLIFAALFLYQFVTNIRSIPAYFKDFPRFPFESALFFFPFILIPVVIFTFWKRKTIGWMLLTIFLTYAFICAFLFLITSFNRNDNNSVIDNLFPRLPASAYVLQLLFLTGMLYTICKKNIRDIYSISKRKMSITIGLTALLTLIVTT
jgi:hypothetical protein